MKIPASFILSALALLSAAAAVAGDWKVDLKAVNGGVTYSHAQSLDLGEQSTYDGKVRMRGPGRPRELIFNSLLNQPEEGLFRLDYQVELTGEHPARPPFQASGKVLLRPGKPVLAAEAGGWKLILELKGSAGGDLQKRNNGTLATSLKCGRASYPANFAYLPEEQYTAVQYDAAGDTVRKFMVGLLPNAPALDGTFLLQYTLQLKEGGETAAEGQGELILAPGGPKRTAKAGKDCVFSARALR
ncbi:MAG: hypothetical protein A2X32_01875 [Elusimicrobia bacterium GWC2_64_44]|nr:MAG: hypothetical protein A2X32_01875 [Elusimicrobia bacterium GWC2_64_44]